MELAANEPNDAERFTAICEAGHAVAHERLFGSLRMSSRISIEPLEDTLGDYAVADLVATLYACDEETERLFLNEAICACAGYAAILVAGHPGEPAVLRWEADFAKTSLVLEIAKEKAVELMRREENIRAVKWIADELLRRRSLSGDHAAILIKLANGDMPEDQYRQNLQRRDEPSV